MIPYDTNFNTNGSPFPNTAAINVSIPGAGDGTEFKALMVNDHWGARQTLMAYAGLTPNGSSEAFGNSQFYTALLYTCMPVGTVIMTHSNSDPTTLGYRFLPLSGSGVLRTLYPDLDAACYVGDANNSTADNWYRSDDAAGTFRNIAGAYIQVADMRGVFPRGWDTTAVRDPDGATRVFPDLQDYALQTHLHEVDTVSNAWNAEASRLLDTGTTWTGFEAKTASSSLILRANENITKVSGPGPTVLHNIKETRSVNVQVKYWVRY
jgi:hypothetical protein